MAADEISLVTTPFVHNVGSDTDGSDELHRTDSPRTPGPESMAVDQGRPPGTYREPPGRRTPSSTLSTRTIAVRQ